VIVKLKFIYSYEENKHFLTIQLRQWFLVRITSLGGRWWAAFDMFSYIWQRDCISLGGNPARLLSLLTAMIRWILWGRQCLIAHSFLKSAISSCIGVRDVVAHVRYQGIIVAACTIALFDHIMALFYRYGASNANVVVLGSLAWMVASRRLITQAKGFKAGGFVICILRVVEGGVAWLVLIL